MPIDYSLLGRVETLLFLLVIATVSAILLKKLKIPYTIGLVPVGIGVAALLNFVPALAHYRNLQLNQQLIMYVLLPTLIFDASVNIDAKLLKRNLYPTLMLAAPGLVIATLITGLALYFFTSLSMASSMIFGALISATDPVAVISLFEMVGAPRRLRILVDGESLFNDATAIAMFNLVMKLVLAGTALTWGAIGSGAVDFCSTFFLGLLAGAVCGFLMAQLISLAGDDPHIQVALSIVLAYGTFLFADRVLHASGVMAALGAGVVVSYYGDTRFSARVKAYLHDYWAFMSFLANSAIFLLLGFTEENILFNFHAGTTLRMVLIAILAIQAARLVVVFGLCPLLGRGDKKISLGYQTVMFWGGLRGAVPLALVFSLPADLPERQIIMQITLAVVLFTLLVQGLTTHKLLQFFRLDEPELFTKLASKLTMLSARRAGLAELKELGKLQAFPLTSLQALEQEYRAKVEELSREIDEGATNHPEEHAAILQLVWAHASEAEHEVYDRYHKSGLVGENVCRRLFRLAGYVLDNAEHFQEPTPQLDRKLLDRRRRSLAMRMVRHAWFRRFLPRLAFRLIRDEFTSLLCIGIAAEKISSGLDDLPKNPETDAAIRQCHHFYHSRRELVIDGLRSIIQLDPQLVSIAQTFSLRQMVLTTELEKVETIVASGALSENEGDKLIDRIQATRANLTEA